MDIITHTHIIGLSIDRNYEFNLNNVGYVIGGKVFKINSTFVRLISISPANYYKKYLAYRKDEWLKGIFDIEWIKQQHHNEVFATCKNHESESQNGPIGVDFLLNALKLFGLTVHTGKQIRYSHEPPNLRIYSIGSSEYRDDLLRSSNYEFLDDKKRSKFRKFINKMELNWQIIPQIPYLSIASRHFKRSFNELEIVDQILHLIVSLEALLSPATKIELSHRVAQNASFLISNDGKVRQKVYNLIKDSYDVRSNLAHGSFGGFTNKHFIKTKQTPDKCVKYLRNIVRDVIIRSAIINNKKGKKERILGKISKDIFFGTDNTFKESEFPKMYNHNW